MFAWMLATMLSWTNPAYSATDSTCAQGPGLPANSVRVDVVGRQRWSTSNAILASVNATGRDGAKESVNVDVAGQWTVWVVAVDAAGNASCPSNLVGLNVPPVSVDGSPADTTRIVYDIAGRRLTVPPTQPGVYFTRPRSGGVRRVVVVR